MPANTLHTRVRSIDILRGIIMIVMALDHTRDYFTNFYNNPTDLSVTTTGMFMTRWVTHFCAPVFVFLAGTSVYLSLYKKESKKDAALFLLSRGFFLLLLELTIVRFGWVFDFNYAQVFLQVIWAIGWSMICLSALIFLPFYAILAVGMLMIVGHNAFDSVQSDSTLWQFAHVPGNVNYGDGNSIFILYPLIPWIGVMAVGYCFGRLFKQPEEQRNKYLYLTGILCIVGFVVLRYSNVYGDPMPWSKQSTWQFTILSFINTQKYPPSLLYLLMTLGPAILSLPLLEKMQGPLSRVFTVFGRVPMFYYILHIYLIHTLAVVLAMINGVDISALTGTNIFTPKDNWGFGLPIVYLAWACVIAMLYLPCRWYMYQKLNNKKWWMSYI